MPTKSCTAGVKIISPTREHNDTRHRPSRCHGDRARRCRCRLDRPLSLSIREEWPPRRPQRRRTNPLRCSRRLHGLFTSSYKDHLDLWPCSCPPILERCRRRRCRRIRRSWAQRRVARTDHRCRRHLTSRNSPPLHLGSPSFPGTPWTARRREEPSLSPKECPTLPYYRRLSRTTAMRRERDIPKAVLAVPIQLPRVRDSCIRPTLAAGTATKNLERKTFSSSVAHLGSHNSGRSIGDYHRQFPPTRFLSCLMCKTLGPHKNRIQTIILLRLNRLQHKTKHANNRGALGRQVANRVLSGGNLPKQNSERSL